MDRAVRVEVTAVNAESGYTLLTLRNTLGEKLCGIFISEDDGRVKIREAVRMAADQSIYVTFEERL